MVNLEEDLYLITSKLIGHEQATAFLINKNYAITARHAIKVNIEEDNPVVLEFYTGGGKETIKRTARVVHESEEYDTAILELEEAITHIKRWITLCDYDINAKDNWETAGFPRGWEVELGNKYCYIKGDVYQNSHFDLTTKYDIHLASEYIKEEWISGFGGLSGAAMISNGKIVGIIIHEEYSVIKTPLKAISIRKIRNFLKESGISFESSSDKSKNIFAGKNLLSDRLILQKSSCEELFFKVNYEKNILNLNLSIDSYFIKYNDDGTQKVNNLAKYLSRAFVQYACSLVEINKGINDLMKMMIVYHKIEQCISKMKKNKLTGRLILWMLIEGVIGAPKTFLRIPSSKDREYYISEVHLGINNGIETILHLGDSKLRGSLSEAVREVIKSLVDEVNIKDGVINIQNDIYIPDEYVYNNMEPSQLKDLLGVFIMPNKRNWDNIKCELTIFTGYNSDMYNSAEGFNLTKEEKETFLEQIFTKECVDNEKFIYDVVEKNSNINQLKINWFVLPFNTTDSFEELVLNEIAGECK